jgi:hypothetical protein
VKISQFSPPALVDDFGSAALLKNYSDHISADFDQSIAAVLSVLNKHHAGQCQFYNPITNGLSDPDTLASIVWNGFPRVFGPKHPGDKPNYKGAEPAPGNLPNNGGIQFRPQDEYLEWFVHRDQNKKIIAVDFTCEAYDYYEFLASVNKAAVVKLYQTYIDPGIQEKDLFTQGQYNPWNSANLRMGAMHLTHPANALEAEIKLAADATVRRQNPAGQEPATAPDLIKCAQFGDGGRNSDPKIGFEVNHLARAGFAITLTNPVGLYMVGFDDAGWQFADGTIASGFMKFTRGKPGKAIRGRFELPANLKAQGRTVSDIQIGGANIEFGGQIAEHITMGIEGAACRPGSLNTKLVPCGEVVPEHAVAVAALAAKAPRRRSRLL